MGKIKFPHDDDDNKVGCYPLLHGTCFFGFAVYMVPGLGEHR